MTTEQIPYESRLNAGLRGGRQELMRSMQVPAGYLSWRDISLRPSLYSPVRGLLGMV